MQQEEWRTIPGFTPAYEVSNLGNLRKNQGGGFFSRLGQSWGKNLKGYRTTSLCLLDGCRVSRPIHTLVCLAFLGPRPSARHECNHKNGIKSDNRIENLEWVTKHENIMHAVRTGLLKPGKGRRYTPEQEVKIMDYSNTALALASEFGTTPASIAAFRHRQRQKTKA